MSSGAHHDQADPARRRRGMRRLLVLRLVLHIGAPLAVYSLLRPAGAGQLVSLAVGAAIPVAVSLGVFACRRRVDPIGLLAVLGFVAGMIASVLTGGDALVFQLRDPLLTGTFGLVCVAFAALRRPLLPALRRFVSGRSARVAEIVARPIFVLTTAVVGVIFLVHAAVLVVLALMVPTTAYLALHRLVGLPLLAVGFAALIWYLRRTARVASADSGQDRSI